MPLGRLEKSSLWRPLLLFLSLSPLLLSQAPPIDDDNQFLYTPPIPPPSHGGPPPTCPALCDCPAPETVECGGVDLTAFPGNLSTHTRHLSLQNNQLKEIPFEPLSRLTELRTLNLHNNQLSSTGLPDEVFLYLSRLQYVYLANNRLTVAPRFLPKSLRIADLAANALTEVYPLTFGGKPHLSSVYLHNNALENAGLPDFLFNGSNSVSILILSNNQLSSAPSRLPPKLNKLHLQNNRISWIPSGAFSQQLHLRELYLQNNQLSDQGLQNDTFSKLRSLEYLDLSMNNLTRVPEGLPPGITILHLGKNRISSLSAEGVSRVRSLEYLLLQNNELTASSIHPQAFDKLRRLHTLHIYNNLLERVPPSLPRRLRSLMMLHNRISQLGLHDLVRTYYLSELNLSYNRLQSERVHRLAFRKLRRLQSLDLSGNALTTVPLGLPSGLRVRGEASPFSLWELWLKSNLIDRLGEDALSGLSSLAQLHLGQNRLRDSGIALGSWREVPGLTLLDLSGNQLTQVPSDLPGSLEYLHLQENRISTVPPSAFLSTPQLRGVFLRYNRLTALAVSQAAFSTLRHLQVLDTTGNPEPISIQLHGTGEPATPTDIIPTPTETSQGTRGLPSQQETSRHADTNETVQ
ncbi:podocan-like protein 1 isoform X1 [Acipenser ruthenus]|uniref:podocan-like protein 1 isoform X1 n=1 Tax=Acipenser ruthenus TaxID=7906 RepID=UPI0027421818|nr:podocan-like protein 1 isoform X1 [Acipenser ruthenus]